MKRMLHILARARYVLLVIGMLAVVFDAITSSNTPPAGYTGAPGDNGNCTGCHSGTAITSGTNWDNVTLTTNIPATGYVPGQTYSITLAHTQAGITKFGFQTTVLGPTNAMAGTITVTNATTTSSQISGGRTYINQTLSGTSGSGSISWSFNWTAPSTGVGTVTFYSVVNATNFSNTNAGDQIYVKSFSFQQQNNSPTAVITANKTVVCVGDTIRYQGSGLNSPTSYSWLFPGGSPSSSLSQNVNVVYNTAGTYSTRLTTTNSSGSSTPTFLSIKVNPKPSSTITTTGQVTICGNDSLVMTGAAGVKYRYLWTPTNDTTRSLTVKQAGAYSLQITDSNNCVAKSNTVNVSKKNRPSVSFISSKDSICSGDSVQFTASSPDAILTYTFFTLGSNSQVFQNTASAIYKTALAATLDSFTVSVSDSFCTSFAAPLKRVWVRQRLATPQVSVGSVTSSSIEFVWDSVAGASIYQVSLDTGKTWIQPSAGNSGRKHLLSGLTPNKTFQIRVRAIDQSPCDFSVSGIATATSGQCPIIRAFFRFDSIVCLRSDTDTKSVTIFMDSLNLSKFAVQYQNGTKVTAKEYAFHAQKGNNAIQIRITDSLNLSCPILDTTLLINGYYQPAFLSVLQLEKPMCTANSLQVSFSEAPGGRYKTMLYRNDTQLLTSAAMYKDTLINWANGEKISGIYLDTITGCSRATNTITIDKKLSPTPGFVISKHNLKLEVEDTTTDAVTRTWKVSRPNGAPLFESAKKAIFNLDSAAVYTIELLTKTADSCEAKLIKTTAIVATGMDERNELSFGVFPNPAGASLFVKSMNGRLEQGSFQLFAIDGSLVLRYDIIETETVIDISTLTTGMYFYVIQTPTGLAKGKLVKQ